MKVQAISDADAGLGEASIGVSLGLVLPRSKLYTGTPGLGLKPYCAHVYNCDCTCAQQPTVYTVE